MAHPPTGARARVRRWARSTGALWCGFGAVHAWLTVVGVALLPGRSFYDVDLYRYWVATGLAGDGWPVLDGPWVYPVGALVPMLVPAGVGAISTSGYAIGWCGLITALNAIAVVFLLGRGRRGTGHRAVWWWLAFLVLLGPVAMGRIDAVLAPLVVVALVVATERPRVAAALLTIGAWIKVAPGALLLPLLVVARRPGRDVLVPAALVCTGVVGAVAAGGGLQHVGSFLGTQGARGLQIEAVAASPLVLAALVRDDVALAFNDALVTWEVAGPGAASTARALDALLPLAVAAIAGLLWRARARPMDVLLWGSLALMAALIVVNKVGSPQFVGWLAPPVAVALGVRGGDRTLARVAVGVLAIAALTQAVFPLGYPALVAGSPVVTALLVTRNAALVALLVVACTVLATGHGATRAGGPTTAGVSTTERTAARPPVT